LLVFPFLKSILVVLSLTQRYRNLLGSVNNHFSVNVLYETWLLNYFKFKLSDYKNIDSLRIFNKLNGVTE